MHKYLQLALLLLLIPTISQAVEINNFLQLRFESGQTQSGDGFFGTRMMIENNSNKNWTLGAKIGTGQNNFEYINPAVFYKISSKVKIGSIYSHDSFGNESVGPVVRYADTFGGVSTMMEYSRYLDLHGNNNLHDFWWSIAQNKKEGWKVGAEAWYYHYDEGTENLKLRPLKLSYVFPKDVTAFAMIQRHWNDKGLMADAILCGIEMKF
jgi:hypothetical protein